MGKKLTTDEAAQILGYSVRHLQRLLRLGAIEGDRFNRVWVIDADEVERIRLLQDDSGRYHHGLTSTRSHG